MCKELWKINLLELINETNKQMMYEADQMKDNPVSELHMHKILFILYGSFYSKFNKDLFDANFEAWKYGPVEIDYRNNKLDKFNISLLDEELNYVKKLSKSLVRSNPWLLVENTHDMLCWINNYDENKVNCKIPNEQIKQEFKQKGCY